MLISESQLRSIIRASILKEQMSPGSGLLQILVSDVKDNPQKYLSSKRNKIETITWKGKKYKALGFLEKGNPVALIKKSDLKPQDTSTSGPFRLLAQDKVTLINSDDKRVYNLAQYRSGDSVPVSVRDNAEDVKVNIVTVAYDDDSIADIAIEVGGVLGVFPMLGEPVDVASAILAIYKDPPDYLLAAISVVCALPVIGVGAALARPILRKLKSAKEIGEKIGELALEQGGAELTTTAIKEAKEVAEEIIEAVSKNAPENIERFSKLKETVSEVFDGIDDWIARGVPLDGVRWHLRDQVIDGANLLRGTGLELTEGTIVRSGEDTVNFIGAKFNGKDAVAKIANDAFENVDMWRRLLEIKKDLPDNFKKFIPVVYKTKIASPAGAIDKGGSIVIMEKLFDLSQTTKQALRGQGHGSIKTQAKKFVDINAIRSEIEPAALNLDGPTRRPGLSEPNIKDAIAQATANYLEKNSVPPPPGVDWSKYVPSSEFLEKYMKDEERFKSWRRSMAGTKYFRGEMTDPDVAIEYGKDAWQEWSDSKKLTPLRGDAFKFFTRFWTKFFDEELVAIIPEEKFTPPPIFFPYGGVNTSNLHPDLKEFYEFLNHIASKYNFIFGDLHEGNIMVDAAGNLKLMDIGRFSVEL